MQFKIQHGTLNLLILFILAYLFQMVSPKIDFDYLANMYVFYPDSAYFKPWQLITHIFSHGNHMHLLFNGLGVLMFGNVIEQELGTRKFLLLFFFECRRSPTHAFCHRRLSITKSLWFIHSRKEWISDCFKL